MGKYLSYHKFKSIETLTLRQDVVAVCFSKYEIFIATEDDIILAYKLETESLLEGCSKRLTLVGGTQAIECDEMGIMLASMEYEKDKEGKNIVRVYSNLENISSSTFVVFAGYSRRLKHSDAGDINNKYKVLSIEIPLKSSASCLHLNSSTKNIYIGVDKFVLIYTPLFNEEHGEKLVDVLLLLQIEFSFSIKDLISCEEYFAVFTKDECQIVCLNINKKDIQHDPRHSRGSGKSHSKDLLVRKPHTIKTTFSSDGKFHLIPTQNSSDDELNRCRRSRTITRQMACNYKEFAFKNDLTSKNCDKNDSSEVTITETDCGGLLMFGKIDKSNSVCPRVDVIFESPLRKSFHKELSCMNNGMMTLVYHRLDFNSAYNFIKPLFMPFYSNNGENCLNSLKLSYTSCKRRKLVWVSLFISTSFQGSLFTISGGRAKHVSTFQHASLVSQIASDRNYLYASSVRTLEVYAWPHIDDVVPIRKNQFDDALLSTRSAKQTMLVGIEKFEWCGLLNSWTVMHNTETILYCLHFSTSSKLLVQTFQKESTVCLSRRLLQKVVRLTSLHLEDQVMLLLQAHSMLKFQSYFSDNQPANKCNICICDDSSTLNGFQNVDHEETYKNVLQHLRACAADARETSQDSSECCNENEHLLKEVSLVLSYLARRIREVATERCDTRTIINCRE
ncbi:hypothetical protein HELRODRAFT_194167 [Helobdella robusta]|uniref:Uncharacterized protein n=1 Tax=Helobdella robusta TaxID=6412 RepID=T1FVR9_HELRO|nr:hypothetical protein HELRODRAFT_194167 [Helobdella robusta]ESN93259.1 hypothetical protein HELRODRAFT_194167 [Helobdella robusta]